MGVTRAQVAQNREDILTAAEELIRARGADAVSLVDLMAAAGLTRGGFYNHFASKDALVAAVVNRAMAAGYRNLDRAIADAEDAGRDPVLDQFDFYLSETHCDATVDGCPNACFAAEAPRLAAAAQEQYGEGLARTVDRLAEAFDGEHTRHAARASALAAFSEMVGALLLARAVRNSDPHLSSEILDSAHRDLRDRHGAAPHSSPLTEEAVGGPTGVARRPPGA